MKVYEILTTAFIYLSMFQTVKMNKNIISLGLCMCSILLLTSAHRQKRSIFSVRKYNPLSQNEVQYYLQELQELKQRLNGGKSHGSKSRRRDRHSKKGGKRSGRDEPTWRAGMSWWDSTHGKKAGSSSGSWASSSLSYSKLKGESPYICYTS